MLVISLDKFQIKINNISNYWRFILHNNNNNMSIENIVIYEYNYLKYNYLIY